MKAAIYETYQGPITIQNVKDPTQKKHWIIISLKATRMYPIYWHGWMGNDMDIELPNIPRYEFSENW